MNNNYNPSTQENEIERMKQLMGYGLNEGKSHESGNSNVAYHQIGPDGKTYGIIKECNKFYIKVAPKKDTEILAEDYDYIGGYMNKKEYEYPTYTIASKQFGLKMKSLNEAYATKEKKNKVVLDKPIEPAEWQVNETKEMRQEINRFNQLVNNVEYILSEGKEYDGKALQLGDKDVDEEGGNAYQENPTPESKVNNMKEDAPAPKDSDDTYSEKPMSVDQVNSMKETATDPKKADDTYNKSAPKTLKLTNEQAEKVLAWSQDKNYMDTTHGTEIGDSAPYDEIPVIGKQTNEAIHNSEDMNQHTGDAEEYMEPFDDKVNEEVEIDSETGLPTEDNAGQMLVDDTIDDFEPVQDTEMLPDQVLDYETRDDMDTVLESIVNKVVKKVLNENEGEWYQEEPDYNEEVEKECMADAFEVAKHVNGVNYKKLYDAFVEKWLDKDCDPRHCWDYATFKMGIKPCGGAGTYPIEKQMNEDKLNDFGKHPAYQKQPMTTPSNTEPSKIGHEWDDESVKGEQPYGTKILHGGDPYTERVIDMLTDSVVDKLIASLTNESGKKKV